MKLLCAPNGFKFPSSPDTLEVVLYGQTNQAARGAVGQSVAVDVRRLNLKPTSRAWDFLSIALSCYCADIAGHRKDSVDGWTREFDVTVAVIDPKFWNRRRHELESTLEFLTTDRWTFTFVEGGYFPVPPKNPDIIEGDCVALLSGGLDSFVGAIDLHADGLRPVTISHVSRGDQANQQSFPKLIGGLNSVLFGHGARVPSGESPASQRSRSIVFIAYAALVAGCVGADGIPACGRCFVSENGFISLNPPLTPMRVGSLSTRTTHPTYFRRLQSLFDAADIGLSIENRYALKTKGEMLAECRNRSLLKKHAHETTSCGRFQRFNYNHCGRCIPCLVRRAAFLRWGVADRTQYVYSDLGQKDSDHAAFDDVRAAAMACLESDEVGIERWVGATLSSSGIVDDSEYLDMLERSLSELKVLLKRYGVL